MTTPNVEDLYNKYAWTSWFYDLLDYPREQQYRLWRPTLLEDLHGAVIEAGVGTGRNLAHYPSDAVLTAFDLCPGMLRTARRRATKARCPVTLLEADATDLAAVPSNSFDCYFSTFMFCVLPDALQPPAIAEMVRVLKPGGRFKVLEIVYSMDPKLRKRQRRLARFVEKVYGARFDRRTLDHVRQNRGVEVSQTQFLKADTYLLIEGRKVEAGEPSEEVGEAKGDSE